MSPLGKVGDKVTAAMALILLFGCMIFTLAGIGLTGMAPIFGEVGERTAEVAMRDSLPAVRAIVEPAGRVLWTEGGRAVKSLLPEGAVSLGPITIDPIWRQQNGDNTSEDGSAGSSEEGGGSPVGDSSAPTAPTPTPILCTVNTPESRAALTAWTTGDWETAVANINLTGEDDCLAKGLYEDYMADFEIALVALQNADGEATIRAAADTVKRLNPAYPGSYSALRFVEANGWLKAKPLDLTKKHLLAGATVAISSADMAWWCAQHTALCESEGDQFDVSVDFGDGWVATYLFSRSELDQLESALQLTPGGLTTVGNTVSVPGSLLPDPLPAVPAPAADAYAAPTPPPAPTAIEALCPSGKALQAGWNRWEMVNNLPTLTSTFVGGETLTGEQLGQGRETLCRASDNAWAWPGTWLGW